MKQTRISNATVGENPAISGYPPPNLVPSLGKLSPAVSIPENPWSVAAPPPQINGYLPHINNLSPHLKIQESTHTHTDSKASGKAHSEIGKTVDGYKEHLGIQQYWNHDMFAKRAAATLRGSPPTNNHPDTNHMLQQHNSGIGYPSDVVTSFQSKSHHHHRHQYSPPHIPRDPSPSSESEIKRLLPSQYPANKSHHHHPPPHTSRLPPPSSEDTYSPVDLAAESLLSLSGSFPGKGFSFPPYHTSSEVQPSEKAPKQAPRGAALRKPCPGQGSPSPFTKVSHINKLTTSEGYAVLSGLGHHSGQPPQGKPHHVVLPDKMTTPSPKVHVLPTHVSESPPRKAAAEGSRSGSWDPVSRMSVSESSRGGKSQLEPALAAGYKTPERSGGADSPPLEMSVSMPEEIQRKLRILSNNEKLEAPKCGCLEHDADEAPYYTHLGAGPTLPAIRKVVEKRFGCSEQCIRIEKLVYSGKEGRSSQGCPIAKWIIRRGGDDEKYLVLVRNRPGHRCDTAYIIIAIVAWDAVESERADYLYDLLRNTLQVGATPTVRKCATNEEKTCACQGFNPDTCGASFSFGCSWSMYFNACKFARSKAPRKFKLQDNNTEGEEHIEFHFQKLAGSLGPLYQRVAPESYDNQVAFENNASECRLGREQGRPFSGVTACLDFCAHAHRDQQNMNNGATVVVTLTKETIRHIKPLPGDEQLHILPLYYLDSTDEFGNSEGQQEKVRNGSLEVLTNYRHKSRLRQKPVIPRGAVKPRSHNSGSHDKSSPGKASKTVANLLASASSKTSKSEERGKGGASSSLPPGEAPPRNGSATHASPFQSSSKDSRKGGDKSAFASPSEAGSPWKNNVKSQYPHVGADPNNGHPVVGGGGAWPKEMLNGSYGAGLRPGGGFVHPELLNGMRSEGAVHGGMHPHHHPEELMPSMYSQYSHWAPPPPGYHPGSMALNGGVVTPEQLQHNPHLAQMMGPYAMEYMMGSPYMRYHQQQQQYPPHMEPVMEPLDIKPDPQQLNEMMRSSFDRMYSMQTAGGCHGRGSADPGEQKRPPSEQNQPLNGYGRTYPSHPAPPPSHEAIWRPHAEDLNAAPHSTTPINAMEQSVNSIPNHPAQREDAKTKDIPYQSSGHHHAAPKFPQTYPLKVEDPNEAPACSSPEPAEEEYFSDSEKCFQDPTIGGVAIALTHGSVLFECAKRELHATTSLISPCRQMPTRISLVFYQHKQMNYQNHGIQMYEKKIEAKKALLLEEGGGKPPPTGKKGQKRSSSSDDGRAASSSAKSKPRIMDRCLAPTRRAVTPITDTMVTVASYAPTTVTGPYQNPQGKSSQFTNEAQQKRAPGPPT